MTKHLETLKAFQSWRRDLYSPKRMGEMDELGLSPKNIGEALEWAIAELDDAQKKAHPAPTAPALRSIVRPD